jgi:amino acid permease
MFKKLTDFKYQRSSKEAVGFYIAYLIVSMLGGALLGGILGAMFPDNPFQAGVRGGTIVAVFICILLSWLIIKEKRQTEFSNLLLVLLSGVLALLVGGLFGLIIPAYLTTKKKK